MYMSDNAGEIQCFSVWPLRGLVDLKALFSAKSAQEKFTEVPVKLLSAVLSCCQPGALVLSM